VNLVYPQVGSLAACATFGGEIVREATQILPPCVLDLPLGVFTVVSYQQARARSLHYPWQCL
jgi:hypothetical protein